MSEGWKLLLDIFNAGGTVISLVGAILSLKVLFRVREIRDDLVLRGALPGLRERMIAANKNLAGGVKRKAYPGHAGGGSSCYK